jgi:hypothetical protein
MHQTNFIAIWMYCDTTFLVQQVVLPHTLLHGTRLYCHINYFMAMDVVATYRPSWQLALYLRTIFCGSRLNYHVKSLFPYKLFRGSMCCCHIYYFIAQDHIAMHNCFVVIGHIATGKSFVATISITTKNIFYGDTISQIN